MGEQSQKEGKATKKFEVGTLVFPSNLRRNADAGGPYIRFEIEERVGVGEKVSAGEIFLYMPNNISMGDGMTYGSFDKGITGVGADLLKNALGQGDNTNITEADAIALKDITAAKVPGLNTPIQLASIEAGITQNPNAITTFDGIQVRKMSYTFKLAAQTEAEAEDIKKICNAFRFYMYPEKVGEISMQFPAEFKIHYLIGEDINPYIPQPKTCFLESMTENTNASGNAVHRKGQPIEVDLTLNFTETQQFTRNELFSEYGDWVGKDPDKTVVSTGGG